MTTITDSERGLRETSPRLHQCPPLRKEGTVRPVPGARRAVFAKTVKRTENQSWLVEIKPLAAAIVSEGRRTSSVWDSPVVQKLLEQPVGSPVDLTGLSREEIVQLAREAKGMWKDRPEFKDSVKYVRKLREWRDIPER